MNTPRPASRTTRTALAVGVAAALLTLAACGGGQSSTATSGQRNSSATGAGAVLPVTSNPIANSSTAQALTIDSVLVENNEDASGSAVDDHLEIAVSNAGSAELTGFEVYYTITDPKTSETESYYAELPADFTIAPGDQRVIHFDNSGEPDHFPVNQYSLYYTDKNALDVTVQVSAVDSAPQTAEVAKDAGGTEEAD